MVTHSRRRYWLAALSVALVMSTIGASSPNSISEQEAVGPAKPATQVKPPAGRATTLAAAAAPPAEVHAPAGKKELVIAMAADIAMFDPHMSTAGSEVWVTFNLFDNLLTRGTDNKLKPALATGWKRLSDTTWQFALRRGVKFHNGDPFTAQDVKFSLDRTGPNGDPKAVTRGSFVTTERIDVVDDYTVNIVTKEPDPVLPDRLAHFGGQIMPKQYFEKVGADQFNVKPIGTGSLKFVEWVKDDHHTLDANRDWYGGKIAFDRVIFKPIPEMGGRVAALLKGEVDIANKMIPDDRDRVNKSPNAMMIGSNTSDLNVLVVPYTLPFPLNNKAFHQALSLAIDRQSIVRNLFHGDGRVPNGFWPSVDWSYDRSLPPLEYNPAKAKELIQKAGYKGEPIVLYCAIGLQVLDQQVSEAIVNMWRGVGINAKLEIIEYSVRAQMVKEKSFKGAYWVGPTSIFMDPDGHAYRLFGPQGQHNFWLDPEWNRLMSEARVSLDQAKRKANFDAANKIMIDYMPYIPVIQPYNLFGVQRYINWKPRENNQFIIQDVKLR
jgi:peptide/nickel transport system substrate-binding protein